MMEFVNLKEFETLNNRIANASSKAVETFVTRVLAKHLDGRISVSKTVQHNFIHDASQIKEAIDTHLDAVDKWSQSIDILGMPRPKNLDDLYIKLSLTDDPKRFRLGQVDPSNLDYTIEDAIATGHHLLILGDPGCGKTTTEKKIARDLLHPKAGAAKSDYIPIVIRLRDLKHGTTLLDTLKQIFEIQFEERGSHDLIKAAGTIPVAFLFGSSCS